MKSFKILFLSIIYLFLSDVACENLIVTTKYGKVRGQILKSRCGNNYLSFTGIPYAKPPLDELRFANPQPPNSWNGTLNATKNGPYCIQKNYFFKNPIVEGQEDCLYLNVYKPQTDNHNSVTGLPVMIFLHWGAFFAGRGTSDYIGPDYFMDKDVILVTLNYRLGVMGFFSTLDDNAPGNLGLKDQNLAMRWVKENIQSFGGDPNMITLFGQSAGGGSVHLHMLSPLSQGLFSGAISQSGTALALWARPTNALVPNITAAQALFVGCQEFIGKNKELINCLRKVDANTLVNSGDYFKFFNVEPLAVYAVVAESQTAGNPNPFLTKDPAQYIQENNFSKVPWIVSGVQNEGILRAAPLTRQPDTLKTLNANFTSIFKTILYLTISAGDLDDSLLKNITDFYLLGEEQIDPNNTKSVQGLIDLYTDRSFNYGAYQSLLMHSMMGHNPIWVMNFNYRGQYSYGDLFAATDDNINFKWGVSHCDDLLYLFSSSALFPKLENKKDLKMSTYMIDLWTNFAKYRTPLTPNSRRANEVWEPLDLNGKFSSSNINFLNITGSYDNNDLIYLKTQRGFLEDRMQFWNSQQILERIPGFN